MQFSSLFTMLATAALASAVALPVALPEPVPMPQGTGVGALCGQSQEMVACCNGGGSQGSVLPGLLSGLNLFGGACSLDILGDQCSSGALACCPTRQTNGFSFINVGSICAPISI